MGAMVSARTGDALCWLRAFLLALVGLLTGATGHLIAGGTLPAPSWLAALVGLVAVAVRPFLREPASTRRVVVVLASGEAFVHVALSALTARMRVGDGSGGLVSAAGSMPPMEHHAPGHSAAHVAVQTPAAISMWFQHLLSEGISGNDVLMADAHLVAVIVVGLWLSSGERALWALLSLAAFRFVAACVALSHPLWVWTGNLPLKTHRAATERLTRPPSPAPDCPAVTRRGPPRVLCA
jgi:hypothetical protein